MFIILHSDVAGIKTTARKSECGRYYIVNGVKKWITNGTFADYFTTAVRTGGSGMGGISVLLIERGPGVTTKKIKTSYSGAAGTAYIEFEDVKVPMLLRVGLGWGTRRVRDPNNTDRGLPSGTSSFLALNPALLLKGWVSAPKARVQV